MIRRAVFWSIVLLSSLATPKTAESALVVQVDYTGDDKYASAFQDAADTWESLLVGYQNGFVVNTTFDSSYRIGETLSTVYITAAVEPIDGTGGILGQAGPTELALDAAGYFLATDGLMEFDSADVQSTFDSGSFTQLVLHEMAHVLGFGTLWTQNNVYVDGSGEFLGANATAAWQSEFDQSGTPDVELGGESGTANGHWNENEFGSGLTGITDPLGRDMRDELMTGWLNPNSFISDMTVASFVDIGFTGAVAVPEPTSWLACAVLVGSVAAKRVRRGQRSRAA